MQAARWWGIGISALAVASGCQKAGIEDDLRRAMEQGGAEGEAGGGGGGSWHAGSGLCFGPEAGGWSLAHSRSYDNPGGEDRSFGYTRSDSLMFATMYVYPRHGEPTAELTLLERELALVMHNIPGATWQDGGTITWVLREREGPYTWGIQAAEAAPGGQESGTLAAVWDADPWFIKVRLTWTPPGLDWQGPLLELLDGAARPCQPGRRPPPEFDRL